MEVAADSSTRARIREINERAHGTLAGLLGIKTVDLDEGLLVAELEVRPQLLAANGYLHAGSVVSLADTACGIGTMQNRPEGATGFTTIELKSNFLGTARAGTLTCTATMAHGGRTTQVWDARVSSPEREIALFRCTQLLLYPPGEGAG